MKTEKGLEKFIEMFTGLCNVFEKEYNKSFLDIYYKALQNFNIDEVETAINNCVVRCKFFPKPVEILEYLGMGQASLKDKALIEAGRVLQAIKKVGIYKSVVFDDPVTMAVITQGFGGWVQMCRELTVETEKWFQKDFVNIYSAYARSNMKHVGHLSGLHEIDNESAGHKRELQIAYIGDDEECKKIACGGFGHKDILKIANDSTNGME